MSRRGRSLTAGLGALLAATTLAVGCGDDEDTGAGIKNVADLKGKIVGAQKGTTGAEYAKDKTDAKSVRTYGEIDDAFNALEAGQVDAVVNDFPVSKFAEQKKKNLKVVATIPTGEQYGLAMAKDSNALRLSVDAALNQMKKDGSYERIYTKWFKQGPPARILETEGDAQVERDNFDTQRGGTLTVGSDIPYEPFEFGRPPNYEGFDIDIVNEVGKRLGLKVDIKDTSFDTVFRDLAQGKFDLVASSTTITPERQKEVAFSEPYFPADQSILVKQE